MCILKLWTTISTNSLIFFVSICCNMKINVAKVWHSYAVSCWFSSHDFFRIPHTIRTRSNTFATPSIYFSLTVKFNINYRSMISYMVQTYTRFFQSVQVKFNHNIWEYIWKNAIFVNIALNASIIKWFPHLCNFYTCGQFIR